MKKLVLFLLGLGVILNGLSLWVGSSHPGRNLAGLVLCIVVFFIILIEEDN